MLFYKRQTLVVQPDHRVLPAYWRMAVMGQTILNNGSSVLAPVLQNSAVYNGLGGRKILDCTASGTGMSRLSFGAESTLQLSSSSGVISYIPEGNTLTGLFTTRNDSAAGGFTILTGANGFIKVNRQDEAELVVAPANTILPGVRNNIAWSYNNATGAAKLAVNGKLFTDTVTATFSHGVVAINGYYNTDTAVNGRSTYDLFAISQHTSISTSDLVKLSLNPWQMFAAQSSFVYVPAAVGGGFIPAWARQRANHIGLR